MHLDLAPACQRRIRPPVRSSVGRCQRRRRRRRRGPGPAGRPSRGHRRAAPRCCGSAPASMSASRPGTPVGIARNDLAAQRPGHGAADPVGIARDMGQDMPARPTRQQRRRADVGVGPPLVSSPVHDPAVDARSAECRSHVDESRSWQTVRSGDGRVRVDQTGASCFSPSGSSPAVRSQLSSSGSTDTCGVIRSSHFGKYQLALPRRASARAPARYAG